MESKKQYRQKGSSDDSKVYKKKATQPTPSSEEGFTGTPD